MTRRLLLVAAPILLVVAGVGCGDDSPTSAPSDCTPIEDGAFTMVAENLSWNVDCLIVAVGTEITFTVDNRDRSVVHNLSITGPSGDEKTKVEAGPVTQTLVYDATEPGRHKFVCDPHAGTMKGDLWVEPAGG